MIYIVGFPTTQGFYTLLLNNISLCQGVVIYSLHLALLVNMHGCLGSGVICNKVDKDVFCISCSCLLQVNDQLVEGDINHRGDIVVVTHAGDIYIPG